MATTDIDLTFNDYPMFDLSITLATLKAIAGVARDAGRIDLYNEVISLQQTVLELVAETTRSVEENARVTRDLVAAQQEVAQLKQVLSLREQMSWDKNTYWRSATTSGREGPFCPKCLDGSERASRMADRPDDDYWRCAVCDTIVQKPGPARGFGGTRSEWNPLA